VGDTQVVVRFDAPPPDINLYALALEVTQAIQGKGAADGIAKQAVARSDSELPAIAYAGASLVEGKRTVVRAYAIVEGAFAALAGVPAQLVIRRADAPVGEVTLSAFSARIDPADDVISGGTLEVAPTLERKRRSITSSWNFVLPDSLTREGRIDSVQLRVNPPALSGPPECSGCDDAANVLTVANIPFSETATLSVRPVLFTYDPAGFPRRAPQLNADLQTFCGQFARMYPVRDGCGRGMGIDFLSPLRQSLRSLKYIDAMGNVVRMGTIQDKVCKLMVPARDAKPPVIPRLTAYYGLVPAGTPAGPPAGVGGPVDGPPPFKPCAASFEVTAPGVTPTGINVGIPAQEVGHGFLQATFGGSNGYWHACGGDRPLPTFPLYRDAANAPYFTGSIGQFGLDTTTLSVFDPSATVDFMGFGYCGGGAWVSPFTWEQLFSRFRLALTLGGGGAATLQAAADAAERFLTASGEIGSDGTVSLAPFYVSADLTDSGELGDGAYSIELQDGNQQVLSARRFDVQIVPDLPDTGRFYQTLPFAPATARVVVKQGETVLATRDVSEHSPSVTVIAPNGGESWPVSGTQVISWMASDADHDPLFFLVQYSYDGGQTWETLASDVTEDHLEVDAALLPGSDQARVRVLASDGINTSADQSDDSFRVARKDPVLFITGVDDNGIVELGSVLNLIANTIDLDAGALSDQDFIWRSDRVGILGTGPRLEVPADLLPPGPHQLTLTIPGRQGAPITRRVSFLRAPRLGELRPADIGDCNQDGCVTVDEILTAVNIALGTLRLDQCMELDSNGDGVVSIAEILTAVNNALSGCAGA